MAVLLPLLAVFVELKITMLNLNQHRRIVDELLASGRVEDARDYCRQLPNPTSRLWLAEINTQYPTESSYDPITPHPDADSTDTHYPPQSHFADDDGTIYDGEITPHLRARYYQSIGFYGGQPSTYFADGYAQSNYVEIGRFPAFKTALAYFQVDGLTLSDIDPLLSGATWGLFVFVVIVLSLGTMVVYGVGGSFLAFIFAAIVLPVFAISEIALSEDQRNGAIALDMRIGTVVYYHSRTQLGGPIRYQPSDNSAVMLNYPPCASSLAQAPSFIRANIAQNLSLIPTPTNDHNLAIGILRGVVLGLWATDHIQFVYQTSDSYYVDG